MVRDPGRATCSQTPNTGVRAFQGWGLQFWGTFRAPESKIE